MKKITQYIATLLISGFMIGGAATAVLTPGPTAFADDEPAPRAQNCGGTFFLTPWYAGLTDDTNGKCQILSPNDNRVGGISNFIWTVALNIITIALQIIGYAAIFYIIYGGFRFMTSNGAPDQRAAAMKTVLNAIIGLVVAIASVAIVRLIARIVTGSTNNAGIFVVADSMTIINGALNIAYLLAGAIAVIMGVLAGFNYVTSAGDPQKAAKARNTLLYSIIGLAVVFFAATITNFIQGRFS